MKKDIIIWSLVALTLGGCGEDFLNTSPSNAVSTEMAITNVNEAKFAVNGLYDILSVPGYYGAAMFYYGDVRGDDMQTWVTTHSSFSCYMFNHRATSLGAGSLWGQPFYAIRNASSVINAIDNGKVKDGSEVEINNLKGQAMTVRALAHFDLVRCFGYPYAKNNGSSWGIPIVDHVLQIGENPIRNTVAECYDFIIEQLELAIPLMSTGKNNGKTNAYSARALLARVCLYREDNEKAFEVASTLIEELKANGQYQLYTNAKYLSAWTLNAKFGSESLFEIANSAKDNGVKDCLAYLMHWWGYADMVSTRAFRDLVRSDSKDVRNKLIVEYKKNDQYIYTVNKYPGPSEKVPSYENNYVVLRLSEVYLIAAEAGVKLGGTYLEPARGYLNAIVSRGNPANTVSSAKFTLARVLTERRKELIGEGHRYFDLLRNGLKIDRQLNLKYGYHLPNAPTDIDWDFEKCILPIPANQFKFNPDMQQNPGYMKE